MKKTYIKPSIEVDGMEPETIICGSVTSDLGIGYGGIDEEGELDAASRRRRTLWEDDEEAFD